MKKAIRTVNEEKNITQDITDSCENSDVQIRQIQYYYPGEHSGNNISKVRQLFQYGIPDMYSRRITIDPKTISKWLRNGMFSRPATEILKVFDNYPESFIEYEYEIIKIIRERSKYHSFCWLSG